MCLEDKNKLADVLVKRYFRLVIPVLAVCVCIYGMANIHMFQHVEYAETVLDSTWMAQYYTLSRIPLLKVFTSPLFEIWFLGDTTFSTAFWMLNILFIGSYMSICLSCIYWKVGRRSIGIYIFLILALWIVKYKYYAIFVIGTLLACLYREY